MAVKTITVTEDAYVALKSLKESNESFSETLLRVAKKRPLSDFFGILGKESGERLEKTIYELRKKRNEARAARMKKISAAFQS